MTREVFVDSGHWFALLNPRDPLHEAAKEAAREVGDSALVTTEMVLAEVLASLAGKGPALRRVGVEFVRALKCDSRITVVPQTRTQFDAALRRYERLSDKSCSLTDCASFEIMEDRGITDALTADADFRQAGFRVLL